MYLKTTIGCKHNSAMKHVKALKKVVRIGLKNDFIRKDPFSNYQFTKEKVNRERLTEEEIKRLEEKEFSIERIDKVRDLFLFQCHTGLAYKDLSELSTDDIQTG